MKFFTENPNEVAVLFLNDCNGYESLDPVTELVFVENFEPSVVKRAEKRQIGVERLGGNWREAVEAVGMLYRVVAKGKRSEFTKELFCDNTVYEYKVISGNY